MCLESELKSGLKILTCVEAALERSGAICLVQSLYLELLAVLMNNNGKKEKKPSAQKDLLQPWARLVSENSSGPSTKLEPALSRVRPCHIPSHLQKQTPWKHMEDRRCHHRSIFPASGEWEDVPHLLQAFCFL